MKVIKTSLPVIFVAVFFGLSRAPLMKVIKTSVPGWDREFVRLSRAPLMKVIKTPGKARQVDEFVWFE